jgi:hypothetical protein
LRTETTASPQGFGTALSERCFDEERRFLKKRLNVELRGSKSTFNQLFFNAQLNTQA